MSEEHLKKLAELTILNSRLIGNLSSHCVSILEHVLPLLHDKKGATALLHDIEQIQAHARDLQPALDDARNELGL